MKTQMSLDGLQTVIVPIEKAVMKAINKLDEYNLEQLRRIVDYAKKHNRITKADLDYVKDYLDEKIRH